MEHWAIDEDGGSGIHVENHSTPNDLPFCWVTSYSWSQISQLVALPKGNNQQHRRVHVYDYYARRADAGAKYRYTATIFNQAMTATQEQEEIAIDCQPHYQQLHLSFELQPEDAFLKFAHAGKDACFWTGWYGARFGDTQVRMEWQE